MRIVRSGCVVLAIAAVACASTSVSVIVDVRKVARASGAPEVHRVVDMGDFGAIPHSGKLPALDSDGEFVVGELVLIEGDDFGKLPTVAIGGRPAAVLARTGHGGIIARIPPAVATGKISVEVSHPDGKDSVSVVVVRYGLAVQPNEGLVHVLRMEQGAAPTLAQTLELPGAIDVGFSPDGQAAYVLQQPQKKGQLGQLGVVVVTASGGPKLVRQLRLPVQQPSLMAIAADAPVLAIASGSSGLLVDLSDSRTPALYEPFTFELGGAFGPRSLALDAEGRTLAVIVAEGNRVVPYDISTPATPVRREEVRLLPSVRHPVLVDGSYSPSGTQLWVAAGDTSLSLAAGHQATRLVAVDVMHGAAAPLTVELPADVGGAAAPVALAASRRETIAPGTSIRSTRKTAAIVMATLHPSIVEVGQQPFASIAAVALAAEAEPGAVLRTDLEGDAQVLTRVAGVVGGLAVSHDSRLVFATTTRIISAEGGHQLEFGVTWVPLEGGNSGYLKLGDVRPTARPLARAPVTMAP